MKFLPSFASMLLIALGFAVTPVAAQSPDFGVVLEAGAVNQGFYWESRAGGGAGVFLQVPLCDRFYFDTELGYAIRGNKSRHLEYISAEESQYLNLDLGVGWKPVGRLHVALGGYAGLLLKSTIIMGKFDNGVHYGNTLFYSPLDFGAQAQVEYFPAEILGLGISVRQGIMNIANLVGAYRERNQGIFLSARLVLSEVL